MSYGKWGSCVLILAGLFLVAVVHAEEVGGRRSAAPHFAPPLPSADAAPAGDEVQDSDFFAFTPANDSGKSIIGMEDWLDAPAGRHGAVRIAGDHFQFDDGTVAKFWGTNLAYSTNCAPNRRDADITAARFAKYGINAVRLHKFTDDGMVDRNNAIKFLPAGFDRFDYFLTQLKARGIYYGFSHTYGFIPGPQNASALLSYNEIKEKLGGNTSGLINFAPDIQNLLIERIVNLLSHVNNYTHVRYANDPALAFVEIQNEDDIFWFSSGGALGKCPTYLKAVERQFCVFLTKKYKTQQALANAWGSSLKGGQTLSAGNVEMQLNPWFLSVDHLPVVGPGERQWCLDTAEFLHILQDDFYGRAVKAIRQTGYRGPICGSPWQAPGGLPAMLNLASDRATGFIDRHNYAGDKRNYDLLTTAGWGFMTVGMQQVKDRPFALSEWILTTPDQYDALGPPVVAAYGLGLQGWDSSYEFQSNATHPGFSQQKNTVNGPWDCDLPTEIGQFPTIARMIYRGDVKEGATIADRRISPENLSTGKFDFSDKVQQNGDVKSFGGSVPLTALAAGKVVNEFTEHKEPSEFPDMAKFTDGSTIVSNTGQLRWDNADQGFITINTDGTKAVVGFDEGKPVTLGKVKITVNSPYASVVLTAREKGRTLANCATALVSAIGVLRNGEGGLQMQGIKADISLAGRTIIAVNVLDVDGRMTSQSIPVHAGSFRIDTGAQKTMYYEVVFAR